MKTDLCQSCGHCWVFQICWHVECSILTASSFRIWNSSVGIPSPLLALFIVMLPKAHLTSCSWMSGSMWMITPSWLSGSLRSFLHSSSVYSYHLFLISSASVRSIPFLSFIVFPKWEIWFQTGRGVHLGCILSPCLFNLYPEFSSVQFSPSVISDSLRPHGLHHTRLPCPSLSPGFAQTHAIESMMPSDHLILCRPLLLPSIFLSIRVYSRVMLLLTGV